MKADETELLNASEGSAGPSYRITLPLSAALFGLFVAAVYFYAYFGSSWVADLDEQIGEVGAIRARQLVDVGRVEQAIDTYRQALSIPFDDPFMRIVAANQLVDLLIERKMYEEAIERARGTLLLDSEEWRPYDQLFRALTAVERHDEALEIAESWSALAQRRQRPDQMEWSQHAVERSRGFASQADANK